MTVYFNFLGQYSEANFAKDEYVSVKFPDKYINFKSNLYLTKKDKEVIRENDNKLTKLGNNKISLGNLAITTGAGAIAG